MLATHVLDESGTFSAGWAVAGGGGRGLALASWECSTRYGNDHQGRLR
ncbi:MAG: hypothetical protein ACTHYM_00515 [Actinomycetaceae bacterium]